MSERPHALPCWIGRDRPVPSRRGGAATGAVVSVGASIGGPTLVRRLPLRRSVTILDGGTIGNGTIGDGAAGRDRARQGQRP